MRIFIFVLLILSAASSILAEDYRPFTDKEGRTIEARIIKMDGAKKTITLERRNKKQATVPISIFSDADQAYILSWTPSSAVQTTLPSTKPEKLSKDRIKEIADEYEEKRPWQQWRKNSESRLHNYNQPTYIDGRIKSIFENGFEIQITGYAIFIRAGREQNEQFKYSAWVLFTPDGDIKYDSFTKPHPLELIHIFFNSLASDYIHKIEIPIDEFISNMEQRGIPTFNLQSNVDRDEFGEAVEEIIEWIIDNGEFHDISEPKVFLPSKAYDEVKKSLKGSKQHF